MGGISKALDPIGLLNNESDATPSRTLSGYQSLPGWAQDIYGNEYNQGIRQYINSPEASQFVPINPAQQAALDELGGGIEGINQNLGRYMSPYRQFVHDEINREADLRRNNIMGGFLGNDGVGINNSALGVQLGMNDEARQRALAQANAQAYEQALGLRNQTLQQMLGSGEMQRGFEQERIGMPFVRLQKLGSLLGALPTGQEQVGAMDRVPGKFERGLGMAISGAKLFGGMGA